MNDPVKVFCRSMLENERLAPAFGVVGLLLVNVHWIYLGGVLWEIFGKKRAIGEAIWWPIRTAGKVLTWAAKTFPGAGSILDEWKQKLDEIHKPS